MRNKTTIIHTGAIIAAAVMLTACGGGGSESSSNLTSGYPQAPTSCEIANQRAWLRDYMNDQYFWYDKQGAAKESSASMAEYLDALLFKPIDRYSFVSNKVQYVQITSENIRTGYGYTLIFADAAKTTYQVLTVEPNGTAAAAGLKRGDTIVTINGLTSTQIASGALLSVSTAGVLRSFVVKDTAGVQRSLSAMSAQYELSPVLATQILTTPAPANTKVGYLAYQSFVSYSEAALGQAINKFRDAGVTEVVLDLRYNLGGSVSVARKLASMLGGAELDGKLFADFRYSNKKSANNFSQTFTSSTSSLPAAPLPSLNRIVIITSGNTASASELVLNSLKPFKTLVTVGATSLGKPFGFAPREACDLVYDVVNLEIFNANGVSVPTTGVPATCSAGDDLTRDLGDPAELRTAAALNYIATGACPPVATASQEKRESAAANNKLFAAGNSANVVLLDEDGRALPAPREIAVNK